MLSGPGDPAKVRLTGPQRRHITHTLERLIRETREQVTVLGRSGADPEVDAELREAMEAILGEAEEAGDRLGLDLEPHTVDPHRRLASWASFWWSTVLDSRPSALRGYGKVDSATAALVAPIVEGLAARLQRVKALAETAGGDG
jgi:hypothetical protein